MLPGCRPRVITIDQEREHGTAILDRRFNLEPGPRRARPWRRGIDRRPSVFASLVPPWWRENFQSRQTVQHVCQHGAPARFADRLGRPSIDNDAARDPVSQEGDKLSRFTEDSISHGSVRTCIPPFRREKPIPSKRCPHDRYSAVRKRSLIKRCRQVAIGTATDPLRMRTCAFSGHFCAGRWCR